MTDDLKAPERIWITHEDHAASWSGSFRSFRASSLDHGNDYQEYVRADRIAALEAEVAHLRGLEQNTYDNSKKVVADLTRERDAAMAGAVKPDMDVIDRSDIDRLVLSMRRRHGSDIDNQAADLILSLTEALAKATTILSALTPDPAALSRIEAQAEARGMRKAANRVNAEALFYAGLREGVMFDRKVKEILALADATEAAANGGV